MISGGACLGQPLGARSTAHGASTATGGLPWFLARDCRSGSGELRARFTALSAAAPDRQAGAALARPHRYLPSGRAPRRRTGSRGGVSIRAFDSGRIGRAACSGAGLSLAKRAGSTKSARPTSAGRVLSISRTRGIDSTPSTPSRYHRTAWWAASQQLLRNQSCPHREQQRVRTNGQPPPRAGGHPPPRARLHAPHARCGF